MILSKGKEDKLLILWVRIYFQRFSILPIANFWWVSSAYIFPSSSLKWCSGVITGSLVLLWHSPFPSTPIKSNPLKLNCLPSNTHFQVRLVDRLNFAWLNLSILDIRAFDDYEVTEFTVVLQVGCMWLLLPQGKKFAQTCNWRIWNAVDKVVSFIKISA